MKEDSPAAERFKPAAKFRLPDELSGKTEPPKMRTDVHAWARKNTTDRWRVEHQNRKIVLKPSDPLRRLLEANGGVAPRLMHAVEIWSEVAFASERDAALFKTFWL